VQERTQCKEGCGGGGGKANLRVYISHGLHVRCDAKSLSRKAMGACNRACGKKKHARKIENQGRRGSKLPPPIDKRAASESPAMRSNTCNRASMRKMEGKGGPKRGEERVGRVP
jgi:hypothetical protein